MAEIYTAIFFIKSEAELELWLSLLKMITYQIEPTM